MPETLLFLNLHKKAFSETPWRRSLPVSRRVSFETTGEPAKIKALRVSKLCLGAGTLLVTQRFHARQFLPFQKFQRSPAAG